jgi:hypothetical protein
VKTARAVGMQKRASFEARFVVAYAFLARLALLLLTHAGWVLIFYHPFCLLPYSFLESVWFWGTVGT